MNTTYEVDFTVRGANFADARRVVSGVKAEAQASAMKRVIARTMVTGKEERLDSFNVGAEVVAVVK